MYKLLRTASLFIMFGFLKSLFGDSPSQNDFPPKPKWVPTTTVDISSVADRARYYTDGKYVIVIFKNGTCVALGADSISPESEAESILKSVFLQHPDFNPRVMDDGNYVVSYSQPTCFSVILKSDFEANQEYIRTNHLDGLVKDEVILDRNRKPVKFDDTGMIGLYARSKMFLDAQKPEIVMKVDSSSGSSGAKTPHP